MSKDDRLTTSVAGDFVMEHYRPIRELLDRIRTRWRLLRLFAGVARGACAASALLTIGLVLARWTDGSPLGLVVIAAASLALVVAALAWGLAPAGHSPTDRRVARFIEERTPALDDRLATAVDLVAAERVEAASVLAVPLVADAARRALAVDVDAVLPGPVMRRAGFRAVGAAGLLLVVVFFAAGPARQSVDAASLLLFPERLRLSVQPGDARVASGTPLSIGARVAGNRAPVKAIVQIEDGGRSRSHDMSRDGAGHYRFSLDSVTAPFRYRVTAGTVASATYLVNVVNPPRVARIDLEYTYPASTGLRPQSEQDTGDIYGPAGTEVQVVIHTDRPATGGRLVIGSGQARELRGDGPTALSARLTIAADDSYRVALVDREGLSSSGDTEYFIRAVDDRPPEVHITKPAGDRAVTRLEEVDVEIQADDDYGVERLELVYAVRGAAEKAMPLAVPGGARSVTIRHTLYLEDLDVEPGDFVSYYARARDHSSGRHSKEARSDILFLDVRPYEQEFSLAASQSMAGSGNNGALDELVNRQRQVVVATWKLNRRAESAKGARSERDIRAVGDTESNLQSLVEQAASSFHESTMRDPRQRGPVGASAQVRQEDEAMASAADAMGKAVKSLAVLDTAAALPPEMQALNHLLRAQAEIKRRQISANQSAAAAAGNSNRNYDISTLFDRELQRQQQTNYETTSPQRPPVSPSDTLDRIRDLAKRQDELMRRQQSLAGAQITGDERKRELERLTREQTELRQRAEELARQMTDPRSAQTEEPSNARGPSARNGQTSRGGGDVSHDSDMRDVSESMRQAAGDLRRGAPQEAGSKSARALDLLRSLQRRLQSPPPGDQDRAIGDMRLEAQELADRQRRIGSERGRLTPDARASDVLRGLAADQERLADRVKRLQDEIKRQQTDASRGQRGDRPNTALREAAREAAGLSDRMRRSADDMRSSPSRSQPAAEEELARQLDRLADHLSAATGSPDDDSRKLSEQLSRAQELRDKLDEVGRAMDTTGRQNGRKGGDSLQKAPGDSGRTGAGRRGAGGVDTAEAREQSLRFLQETLKLVEELRRQDPSLSQNGAGFTFERQGLVLSAPGTEGFKQDFARWELLRRQAMAALEEVESTLAKKLQARASKDRLAAGIEERAPTEYQTQVDAYFKALAARKLP